MFDKDIEEIIMRLRSLGLTLYEAKAYIAILKKGVMTSTEVAKEAGIPQPRVYDVLKSLEEKGLILVSKGRPRLYRAENPRASLKRLIDRIKERIIEDYEKSVGVLERIYLGEHGRKDIGEIWKLDTELKIYDKIHNILDDAEHELLISAYNHMMGRLKNQLKKLSRRGVSVCLITYDVINPQTYVDEHRIRETHGIVIAIPDRKELVFVTNWFDPSKLVPIGFYTQNTHLLKLFTEYFLHNLRDLSKPIYIGFGESVFIRRFVNLNRAIDMINMLKRRGRKVHVKVKGKYVNSGKEAIVEGEPVGTKYDLYAGIARIILRTGDNKLMTIGGWGAFLEDIEAELVEVIS